MRRSGFAPGGNQAASSTVTGTGRHDVDHGAEAQGDPATEASTGDAERMARPIFLQLVDERMRPS